MHRAQSLFRCLHNFVCCHDRLLQICRHFSWLGVVVALLTVVCNGGGMQIGKFNHLYEVTPPDEVSRDITAADEQARH